jgi:23S rRNA (guanosine2251-2'-O)-methyltransferase
MKTVKVRNKNAILELLKDGVSFEKISVLHGLDRDEQTQAIEREAKSRNIPVAEESWGGMALSRSGSTREAVLGYANMPLMWNLHDLLGKIYEEEKHPFFLLLNKVEYENNIGTIARTAYAAGVNGLLFQNNADEVITDESVHISLGALLRIPLIKMGVFEALHELEKNGIPAYALHMKGATYTTKDLTGPLAFVLGAEGEGLSETILNRCTDKLSIPMKRGIDSLNVGMSGAILMYEKVRQEGASYLRKA